MQEKLIWVLLQSLVGMMLTNPIDDSNINASCLNRDKLHLTRQGTSILADNFRISLVNSEWFDESFLNKDGNLDATCINPNASNKADFTKTLRLNRSKYSKNFLFSHLNINSMTNKFENLKEIVSNHVEKLFPWVQFIIEGFHKPLALDIFDESGLLVYVRSY